MPWARFDDRFPSNRKVRLLSDGAFRLYVSAICWSAENLTDGVIKKAELCLVADVKAARTRAQQLVEHGLWEALPDGGWRIHDYHEYNPTAEQVRADRAAKTARQQRWREKHRGEAPPPEPPGNNADVDASTDPSRDASRNGAVDAAPRARVPDPTRPDPSVGSGEGRERGAGSSAHEKPLSLIANNWEPSGADRTAAATDIQRLGPKAVTNAIAKFIRHQQTRGTRAVDFGPAWVTWLARERADTQGAFLVGLPGGGAPTPTPPSYAERMAELDAAAARDDRDETG